MQETVHQERYDNFNLLIGLNKVYRNRVKYLLILLDKYIRQKNNLDKTGQSQYIVVLVLDVLVFS